MIIPFCGSTYESRSGQLDASRSVNFFLEKEPGEAKSKMILVGAPGYILWYVLSGYPIRGWHVFNNLLYFVAGNQFSSVNSAGVVTDIGNLGSNSGRVYIEDNGLKVNGVGGNQVIIVDGSGGYIYDVVSGVFASITGGGGFPSQGASSVDFIDGYFVCSTGIPGSMSFFQSDLYDGTTWNALATSPVSATSTILQRVINSSQQLWMIKGDSTEVWADAGTPTSQGSSFVRITGAVLPYGTIAPATIAKGAGGFCMLATQMSNGIAQPYGVVHTGTTGAYTPQKISTPAIDYQISKWVSQSDAFGYFQVWQGHIFYFLTSPSANQTFVYDFTTGMWWERSSWTGSPYLPGRFKMDNYIYYNGMHLFADASNGNVYRMDADLTTDNGDPLVSFRTAEPIFDKDGLGNLFISSLQIDMETGTGMTDGSAEPAMIALSWSKDGAQTWSNEHTRSIGALGEYNTRVKWTRLGYARSKGFVVRAMISDPVKRVIYGATAEVSK